MAFGTPVTAHLRDRSFESVYEPAEDSFLFLDALQADWNFVQSLRPVICLEVGCGSGIIGTFVAQNLPTDCPCFMLCVDINPRALDATKLTITANDDRKSTTFDTVLSDLATPLLPASAGTFDLILFNPPYVVTSSDELRSGDSASKAWAGGKNGREVIDRFFPQAAKLLTEHGAMYCVAIKENNIDDIARTVEKFCLKTDIIMTRRCCNELLHILRFTFR